ncbi:hypothetical protein B7486_56245 [cyanobacterium TDX16]|nr:hypothetical protein B7486_56245 [cyanobacterium TDX16]
MFCLEGDRDDQDLRDRRSVQPLLELLERLGSIEYVRRDVGTREELERCIRQWVKRRYDNFPVLYLAFHGRRGSLELGNDLYSLEDLADCLHHHRGAMQSVVHFGSCATIRVSPSRLADFSRRADIRTVSGFSKDVDWAEAALLELHC